MDLKNVKDLQKKMRICELIYPIGVVACSLTFLVGALFINTNQVTGIILLGLSILLALIAGAAQVLESLLYAEDLYRITGRRPKKKTLSDPVKSFTRAYAETAGRKTMEDALRLGKELEDGDEVL
jgi:hypothetical protein